MRMLMLGFVLLALSVAVPARALEVTAEGRALFGEETTPGEAKAVALSLASVEAMARALGREPEELRVPFDSGVIEAVLDMAARERIGTETIEESRWDPGEDGSMYWYVRIRLDVEPQADTGVRELRVDSTSVHVPGKKKAESVFHPGSEVQIRVRVNREAHIQMFGIDQAGKAVRLYPNQFAGGGTLSAGKELIYPPENLRSRGVRIRTSGAHGEASSVESILVIAMRKQVRLLSERHIAHPTVSDLALELAAMDPATWAVKAAGYEVRE
jgi:hypothetical protein